MRVVVVGAGGIGAPLGASLAAAGNDVTFIARGAHLAAMRANGLRIEGDRGITQITPAQATDNPAEIGPVDLVLFAVKLWDVETAGAAIRPLIGKDTAVIPLQNGVDASERLAPIIGADHALGGVGLVTGTIIAPGVIRQSGTHHRVTFGDLQGGTNERGERLRAAMAAAGIDAILSPDIQADRWRKFTMLVPAAGTCAAVRSSIARVRDDPDSWRLLEAAMMEVVAVGQAHGVAIDQTAADPALAFLRGVPDTWTPSMAVDIMAGRRLELPWLTGRLVALARDHGEPVPANAALLGVLSPWTMGAG